MILVTGSRGFIGKHLASTLLSVYDGCIVHQDPREPGPFWEIDRVIEEHGRTITAVFHLGAISDTTCGSPKLLYENNEAPTRLLSRFCREKNIPFIWASSASVYGNGDGPLNDYARSKQASEAMLESRQCPVWYACRFFNVYGPGEAHKGKQASLVHQIIETQRDGERPRLFETQTMRDFIHVDDVVDVMLWMWRERPPSGIYDVGTGESYSISRLHAEIENAMGISHDFEEIDMPAHLVGKYQFNTCADLRKLRAAGYTREFTRLPDGIRRMLK